MIEWKNVDREGLRSVTWKFAAEPNGRNGWRLVNMKIVYSGDIEVPGAEPIRGRAVVTIGRKCDAIKSQPGKSVEGSGRQRQGREGWRFISPFRALLRVKLLL